MAEKVQPTDVLLYVNSHAIVRTLSPESHEVVVQGLQQYGYYTYPTAGVGYAGRGGHAGDSVPGLGANSASPIRSTELTEEEQDAVLLVRRVVREKQRTLHIVDVGKRSELMRYIEEHLHHLQEFPVLVRPDGRRLEGIQSFTMTNLEFFLKD